jgi:hypothetical protein
MEFTLEMSQLRSKLRPFFAARARGKEAELHQVDVKAEINQITLVTTGASVSLPAVVNSIGCARIPYTIFETIFRKLEKLGSDRLTISIRDGKLIAGPVTFNHPGISMQLIGTRIAELPVDAPLVETLAVGQRFSQEELMDSGIWAKVTAAQDKATTLIEKAAEILAPLEISADALRSLLNDRIKERQG